MVKKNMLLLSLADDKINKIANVVSNESSKKILDFLASKEDSTEAEIAKKLKKPISTIHYNLQQLMEAGLVTVEEYHYSEKGREVNHYKLANKYIIIAPKGKKTSLGQKLKGFLPVGIIALGTAGIIELTTRFMSKQSVIPQTFEAPKAAVMKAAEVAEDEAADAMITTASEAAPRAAEMTINEAAPQVVTTTLTQPWWQNIALWFLIGAIFTIIIIFIISYIKKNK